MNDLVYDIGMHTGQDARHYLKQGYRVIAVEANPLLAEVGQKKFAKEIAAGKLTILNIGISDKKSVQPFYKNLRLSEWSSFDKELGARNNTNYEVLNVECTTINEVFSKYGMPFYLKIDIEGHDHFCLNGIPDSGEKPSFVSCEACSLDWLAILKAKGYKKFKIISQGDNYITMDLEKEKKWHYPRYQIIRNGIKLRLQKFISFKHEYGSSGPFGENTKGNWMGYEETVNTYNKYYVEQGKPLNYVSWFDFHASL